jgi:carbon storage regulator
MLVLSRKEAQRIRLGDSIVITIVKIGGDKVRIGIDAPADVLVLRDELELWDDRLRDAAAIEAESPLAAGESPVAAA